MSLLGRCRAEIICHENPNGTGPVPHMTNSPFDPGSQFSQPDLLALADFPNSFPYLRLKADARPAALGNQIAIDKSAAPLCRERTQLIAPFLVRGSIDVHCHKRHCPAGWLHTGACVEFLGIRFR